MDLHTTYQRPYIADLCSGVGMLGVGLECATGGSVVLHVERDSYAAADLVARMEEQALHQAPIWDDVGSFDGRPPSGYVDIVCAGFPCQPTSVAGRRLGAADERWIWPHIARAIRDLHPAIVLLENPPGLYSLGIEEILGDLAALGYDAEWTVLGAEEVGAAQRRERVFILGHAPSGKPWRWHGPGEGAEWAAGGPGGDVDSRSLFAPGPDRYPTDAPQPCIRGVADGMAGRMDPTFRTSRIRCIGNGAVPLQVAVAFRLLADRACH